VRDSSCRARAGTTGCGTFLAEDVEHVAISLNRVAISSFLRRSRCPAAVFKFPECFVRLVIGPETGGFGRPTGGRLGTTQRVEIQETFYRPISVERAAKWRAKAPPGVPVLREARIHYPRATSPTYRRSDRVIPRFGEARVRLLSGHAPVRRVGRRLGPFGGDPSHRDRCSRRRIVWVRRKPTHPRSTASFESIRRMPPKRLNFASVGPCISSRKSARTSVSSTPSTRSTRARYLRLAYFRLHGSPPGRRCSVRLHRRDLGRINAICREYDDAYVMLTISRCTRTRSLPRADSNGCCCSCSRIQRHGNLCISGLSVSTRSVSPPTGRIPREIVEFFNAREGTPHREGSAAPARRRSLCSSEALGEVTPRTTSDSRSRTSPVPPVHLAERADQAGDPQTGSKSPHDTKVARHALDQLEGKLEKGKEARTRSPEAMGRGSEGNSSRSPSDSTCPNSRPHYDFVDDRIRRGPSCYRFD